MLILNQIMPDTQSIKGSANEIFSAHYHTPIIKYSTIGRRNDYRQRIRLPWYRTNF